MNEGVSCGSLCLRRAFYSTWMNLYASGSSEIGFKIGGVKLASSYGRTFQYSDAYDLDKKSRIRFLRREADQSVISGTKME